jgi:CheY-like chemotaxis protein
MPVMDGITFLAKKKQAADVRGIPVVLVSASARGPVDGASCVLTKPIDAEDLIRAVERHAVA